MEWYYEITLGGPVPVGQVLAGDIVSHTRGLAQQQQQGPDHPCRPQLHLVGPFPTRAEAHTAFVEEIEKNLETITL